MLVYTTIFGPYDSLREPLVPQSRELRFVCYTNQPPRQLGPRSRSVWQIVPIHDLPYPGDSLWSARWQKLHPPAGESVWIDSNLTLEVDLLPVLRTLQRPMICLPYLRRCCVYDEVTAAGQRVKGQGRHDLVPQIQAQGEHYQTLGVPANNGLHLTGLLYRDGSPAVEEFTARWWAEMRTWHSPRDQIALAKVEWETDFEIASWPRGLVRQFPHTREPAPPDRLRPDGSLKLAPF